MLDIINNKSAMKVVFYLILHPSKELSQKDLIDGAGLSKATMAKNIPFLKKKEIVSVKKIGVTNLVRLNNENVLVKEIKRIKIISELGDLGRLKEKNLELYLYGSCARGEYVEESDVDLLIIGCINREDIINIVQGISKKIRRNISFKIFSSMEWARLSKKDPAFYERVEKDKIRLV